MSQPIFLSSVSKEFPNVREHIAGDLRKTEAEVRDQQHFRSKGGRLLDLLEDYIQRCDAVIHLIGATSGHAAKRIEVDALLARSPDFLTHFPDLKYLVHELSYTQWEAWLALYHRRRLFAYSHQPASSPLNHDPLQAGHLDLIRNQGCLRTPFADEHELRREILISLHDIVRPLPDRKPCNLPYRTLGTLFKGRDEFLQKLRERFQSGETHAIGVLAAQSIHGLGGVGKTRLAIEYAWKHAEEFTALLFVNADSPASLERQLAELVGPLVLDLKEAQQITEQSAQVAAAVQWLQSHQHWFLILDNVDDDATAKHVRQLVAGLTQGQIVITSRLSNWSAGVEKLELDVLAPKDGAEFLLERTQTARQETTDDAAQALSVANDLDGLALALEQAGAYIAELGISFVQYRQRWEAKRDQILNWEIADYPKSLAITWETSFAQLTPAARTMLETLCWFAPEPIPAFVFDDEEPQAAWEKLLNGEDVRIALANLHRYSLIKHDHAGEISSEIVHRLVQEITRRRISEADRNARILASLSILAVAHPGDAQDVRTWSRWNPLAPHYVAVTKFADAAAIARPTARLMNEVAQLFDAKAQLRDAEPLMWRALAINEQSFGQEHPEVATNLNNLAQLLQATDRLTEAEPLMRRALAIDEQSFGQEHPNVTRDLNNLAQLLQATNRLAEAETLMRRALSIDEQMSGPDHPEVAIRLNNLAVLLQATNRLEEAEPLMVRVVTIFEKARGENHPNVATALNNLAQLLQGTNRLEEAELLMRRALIIDEQSFGLQHPKVAIRLNNLARLLQAINRLEEAELVMARAVAIFCRFMRDMGHHHPYLMTVINNYWQLLDTMRIPEAERWKKLLAAGMDPAWLNE